MNSVESMESPWTAALRDTQITTRDGLRLPNLGFPDEAVRQMDQGRALAESLGHPSSLSQALWFAAEPFIVVMQMHRRCGRSRP
jgi:hypothetical protein